MGHQWPYVFSFASHTLFLFLVHYLRSLYQHTHMHTHARSLVLAVTHIFGLAVVNMYCMAPLMWYVHCMVMDHISSYSNIVIFLFLFLS